MSRFISRLITSRIHRRKEKKRLSDRARERAMSDSLTSLRLWRRSGSDEIKSRLNNIGSFSLNSVWLYAPSLYIEKKKLIIRQFFSSLVNDRRKVSSLWRQIGNWRGDIDSGIRKKWYRLMPTKVIDTPHRPLYGLFVDFRQALKIVKDTYLPLIFYFYYFHNNFPPSSTSIFRKILNYGVSFEIRIDFHIFLKYLRLISGSRRIF